MFKNDLKAFLVNSGNRYRLPIYPDVSFSQVYSEKELKKKTLHNPENLISGAYTNTLNPGNFSFTIPSMDSSVAESIMSVLANESFDLNFQSDTNKKLRKCALERITFNLQKNQIITTSISGSYSEELDIVSLEGNFVPDLSDLYTHIEGLQVLINGVEVPHITSISLEIANDISWLNNSYMQDSGPKPKETFINKGRVISGTISQNEDINSPTFNDYANINIKIKSNNEIFLEFDLRDSIVTTRNQLDSVIKKGYDFRLKDNLTNIIKYKGEYIL